MNFLFFYFVVLLDFFLRFFFLITIGVGARVAVTTTLTVSIIFVFINLKQYVSSLRDLLSFLNYGLGIEWPASSDLAGRLKAIVRPKARTSKTIGRFRE